MNYTKSLAMCGAVLIASAAFATVATPVEARERPVVVTGPSRDTVTRYVGYRDLNLASLQGEKTLKIRVRGAVAEVCDEISFINEDSACRGKLWASTHPQIVQALARAREIAMTGTSAIPAVAITIAFPH